MKKFAVICEERNTIYDVIFDTKEKAIEYAQMSWEHMTKREKEECVWFEVVETEIDDDGLYIIESFETIKVYKKTW